MVPREEIENERPATLPADFGEWDSGEPPATQPADFDGFDHLPDSGDDRRPAEKTASVSEQAAALPHGVDQSSKLAVPVAYIPAKPDVDVYRAPRIKDVESLEEEKIESTSKHKSKLLPISIGVLALLLVLGVLGYFKLRSKPVVQNQATISVSQQTVTDTQKPTAAIPETTPTNPTASDNKPVTPPTTTNQTAPLSAQMAAMNHQLSAPSRIPNDLKMLAGKEPSPSSGFSATGLEGMGNSGGNVFSGQSGPKVRAEAPKKVNISAGIAVGLLIKKTPPIYPPIARNAHVAGTVVIQAMISKAGTVQNLHVISGPTMLRQAAQDAVKTWRFRPYLLDGEPVEVETVVNVTFALAQ
jgi:periplasmic protein TonB